ncbi:protein of unknown function [Paraoerskovia marina]|uniref:Carbohydrate-binding domain-containing protein n=1 Tax=Paraoerskovia marina TaxID=545619 RepID=A0A1H1M0X1_9CELL|nr:carbohydrate-binding domain-containing protein [Paraoerskovia marina]SDR80102.1 protein of unknown function [Paraoerskovia marina]
MRRTPLFLIASTATLGLVLTGCAATDESATDDVSTGSTASGDEVSSDSDDSASYDGDATVEEIMADNEDVGDTDAAADAEVVDITLDGGTASSDAEGVEVDGSTVTITQEGAYRISGTLDDGQIVVAAPEDAQVRLILDDADITSSTGSAISVEEADDVVIELADGSDNHVADAESYADTGEDAPNAAIYSTADLGITGTGALTVEGNANDGITSKDGLVIDSGDITVTAVDDGVRGKDQLVVLDGTLTVTAGGDGLKADNEDDADRGYVYLAGGTVDVTAGADGIDAAQDALVDGATVTVVAGGGHEETVADDASAKGVKAGIALVIGSGTVTVDAADDALHSDGLVAVPGGDVTVASGDDGVHADGNLNLEGGNVTVTASYEGLEGSDILIADGDIDLTSTDDAINAALTADDAVEQQARADGSGGGYGTEEVGDFSFIVTGGTILVDAEGDGLDSNGSIDIQGGEIVVAGPTTDGEAPMDANGTFTISGGDLLAYGSSGMASAPDLDSEQVSVFFLLDAAQASGSTAELVASDGTVLATFDATRDFQSVVWSGDDLTEGDEVTLVVDGTEVATATAGDYEEGEATGGAGGPGEMPGGGAPGGEMPQV